MLAENVSIYYQYHIMKHYSLFFLLEFCLSFHMNAQGLKQKRLAKYFENVHQAAVAVCKGEMDLAKSSFNAAFACIPYAYSTDLNNAIYAEIESKNPDTSKVIAYLMQLQRKGVCVHEKYKRQAGILSYTKLVAESYCKKVKSDEDRLLLAQLIAEDQMVRDSLMKNGKSEAALKWRQKLYMTDSINYQKILPVLNKALSQKIPLENLIGMEAYFQVMVIILHYSEQKYEEQKIFNWVKEGILDPRKALSDYDNCVERGYIQPKKAPQSCLSFEPFGTTANIQTFPVTIIRIPPADCLSKINKLRKMYYLQDLIEECKIKSYAEYNRVEGFSYPITSLSVDEVYLEKMEKKIREKYKIIKYNGPEDFDFNRLY